MGRILYTGGHFKWNSSPEIAGLTSLKLSPHQKHWRSPEGGGRLVLSDSPLGFPEVELIESALGSASFHYSHFMRGIQIWCLNLKWNSVVLYAVKGWMDGIKWNMCSSEIRHHIVLDQLCHINPFPLCDAVCVKKTHTAPSQSQKSVKSEHTDMIFSKNIITDVHQVINVHKSA